MKKRMHISKVLPISTLSKINNPKPKKVNSLNKILLIICALTFIGCTSDQSQQASNTENVIRKSVSIFKSIERITK